MSMRVDREIMDSFFTELRSNFISLENASCIVKTSFISHKSISYLDLQLCVRSVASRNYWGSPLPLADKSFFPSEESLLNHLVPERRLLYTLNLDLPDRKEYSYYVLGNASNSLLHYHSSLSVEFGDTEYFYLRVLSKLVETAFRQTVCKSKLLKWIVNFNALESIQFTRRVQLSCAKVLYRECLDSEFATKYFRKFMQLNEFSTAEDIKLLEYFLYHSRVCDFDVRSKTYGHSSLTDYYVQSLKFLSVKSVLKYEDRAYYTEDSYNSYKLMSRVVADRDNWNKISTAENHMSKLRLHRILQIILLFRFRLFRPNDLKHASEALRLIWSSIPDTYVCLEEMNDAYGSVFSAENIIESFDFYKEAIRQTVIRPEPRTLSQYCRSTIRKRLADSKRWLPDGIKQLELPLRLESFLNLQRDNLRPENFKSP